MLHAMSKDCLINLHKYFFINSKTVRFTNSSIYFKPILGFLKTEAATFIFLFNGPLTLFGPVIPFASLQSCYLLLYGRC